MAYFHLKQSTRHLTSTAGLLLIGQCLLLAEVERLDLRLPKRGKIMMSEAVNFSHSEISLLCQPM